MENSELAWVKVDLKRLRRITELDIICTFQVLIFVYLNPFQALKTRCDHCIVIIKSFIGIHSNGLLAHEQRGLNLKISRFMHIHEQRLSLGKPGNYWNIACLIKYMVIMIDL